MKKTKKNLNAKRRRGKDMHTLFWRVTEVIKQCRNSLHRLYLHYMMEKAICLKGPEHS